MSVFLCAKVPTAGQLQAMNKELHLMQAFHSFKCILSLHHSTSQMADRCSVIIIIIIRRNNMSVFCEQEKILGAKGEERKRLKKLVPALREGDVY